MSLSSFSLTNLNGTKDDPMIGRTGTLFPLSLPLNIKLNINDTFYASQIAVSVGQSIDCDLFKYKILIAFLYHLNLRREDWGISEAGH